MVRASLNSTHGPPSPARRDGSMAGTRSRRGNADWVRASPLDQQTKSSAEIDATAGPNWSFRARRSYSVATSPAGMRTKTAANASPPVRTDRA
jgi:hypothetical protein